MGKLYREFFYVPKYGKINDKVMAAHVALCVIVIIACLTALSLSAYAWFSCNITSNTNMIKAADFDITVSVAQDNTSVEPNVDGTYRLETGTYLVGLTKAGNAQTGFCILETAVGETKTTFHTQQLGIDGETERNTLTFTLEVSELSNAAVVTFAPHWGTSLYYSDSNNALYIKDGSVVTVTADSASSSAEKPEEKEPAIPATEPETPSSSEQTQQIHTVLEGENLTWIANQYNTTVEAIAAYNDLEDISTIQIGQQLKIPPAEQ